MPIMFNTLLEAAGLELYEVRLVRHQDSRADRDKTPYALWRDRSDEFLIYQSRQNARTKSTLGKSRYWAVFVVTPTKETLFVGLYDVRGFHVGRPALRAFISEVKSREPITSSSISRNLIISRNMKASSSLNGARAI